VYVTVYAVQAVRIAFAVLEGGPFHHKYQVEQFHFHWGKASNRGSEHLINGKVYPAEVNSTPHSPLPNLY